jgi:hypothetical protein
MAAIIQNMTLQVIVLVTHAGLSRTGCNLTEE